MLLPAGSNASSFDTPPNWMLSCDPALNSNPLNSNPLLFYPNMAGQDWTRADPR